MAAHNRYDRRLEGLVVERKTLFSDELKSLSEDDQHWLSATLHAHPEQAGSLKYERQHTGFCREITVTKADVDRLYKDRFLSQGGA